MWTARIFTLYPELFPGPFNYGLYKKALEKNIWSLEICNIRDGATDKHKTVDDTPFGGGSGMIIKPEVLANSLNKYITIFIINQELCGGERVNMSLSYILHIFEIKNPIHYVCF